MEIKEKTLGEKRVRTDFNVSGEDYVKQTKDMCAKLIDYINALPVNDSEQGRLKSLALTSIEEGAMWAVKAITF